MEMAQAYSAFANGGELRQAYSIKSIADSDDKTVYKANTKPERVMSEQTAYQMTEMMQRVVQDGTGKRAKINRPVAGKTGTTNDAKDVWFIGFTSNIVASCHIGYDQPRTLGESAFGATLCGPVFQQFMTAAAKVYGGSEFKVPPGGYWAKFNRFTGERLPDDATGDFVQAEYVREGQDLIAMGVVVDGGFAMGQNLPLFQEGETDTGEAAITTSSGQQKIVPGKADFGTVSSGGLY